MNEWTWVDRMEFELSTVVVERVPMALRGRRLIDASQLLIKAGVNLTEAARLLKIEPNDLRRRTAKEGLTWPKKEPDGLTVAECIAIIRKTRRDNTPKIRRSHEPERFTAARG